MNSFWRSNRAWIPATILLLVILVSINNPLPDLAGLLNQELNLNKARDITCIEDQLPENEAVIFFANPFDPAANANLTAAYYRAQFFLAPRILHLNNLDLASLENESQWWIGFNLEAEQAELLEEQEQLDQIVACGQLTLFHRD
jgi:hypothetical protein